MHTSNLIIALIILLVVVGGVSVMKQLSSNPLHHIKKSLSISSECISYVKGSDSVYLEKAITYKGDRMIL